MFKIFATTLDNKITGNKPLARKGALQICHCTVPMRKVPFYSDKDAIVGLKVFRNALNGLNHLAVMHCTFKHFSSELMKFLIWVE